MDGEDAMNSFKMPMPVAPPQGKKQDKTMTYVVVALAALGVLAIVAFFVLLMLNSVLLFYSGAMNPENLTPTRCTFPPGMKCAIYKLNTDGSLELMIEQATGHPINVTSVLCTQEAGVPADSEFTSAGVEIPQGGTEWVSGWRSRVEVKCGTGGDAGEFYKGKIWIKYTEIDTTMTRTVVGDLVAKYEN